MNLNEYPAAIQRVLRALEQRILRVFLFFGIGRTAVLGVALLFGLYALDRTFTPPVPMRLVLLAIAGGYLAVRSYKYLAVPLRKKPSPRDLAAIWERRSPGLKDLLITTVDCDPETGGSPELLAAVHEQAEAAVAELDPREIVPAGKAHRSALGGFAAIGLAAVLAWFAPEEASIFFKRLFGSTTPWPHDTTLVLLPPHAEGMSDLSEPEDLGGGAYSLSLARSTVVTLRVRADGVVPDRVTAWESGSGRTMRPLGGGEFVLRLPPLQERREFHFTGGDDVDENPRIELIPGIAPAISEWSVAVAPPEYTGFPADVSPANEFRVPAGTQLTATFRIDKPTQAIEALNLRGEKLALETLADGQYRFSVVARQSEEAYVSLTGTDGFRDARAAVLRWWAEPDRAPRAEFLVPAERWTAIPGGRIPLLMRSEDDYGLSTVTWYREDEPGDATPTELGGDSEWSNFQTLTVPSSENVPTGRWRYVLRATDAATPLPQQSEAQSPWIEVVQPSDFEERLADRMARTRELVDRMLSRVGDIIDEPESESVRSLVRRIRRDLDGMQIDLEAVLLERLYAGVDRGSESTLPTLDELLSAGAPGPGAVVNALTAPGLAPPLDQSGQLLELAQAAAYARKGAAHTLSQQVANGLDPTEPAKELQAQLEVMMKILVKWEDFQSAINLLRGLLDRQRQLYLRTRSATDS